MEQGYLFKDEKGEHLHLLDGKPLTGTSSVFEIVAKPLTWWAVGEGLKTMGWTPIFEYRGSKKIPADKAKRLEAATAFKTGVLDTFGGQEYLNALDVAYYAHSKRKNEAASKGKDLHSKLEKYVKYSIAKNNSVPAVVKDEDIQDFIDWSVEHVEKFLWSEMHTHSREHWVGGITDAGALLKNGKTAIIDFKSSKEAYPNQFWQIGGYSVQIEETGGFTAKGEKVMEPMKIDAHIVIPFGAKEFSPAIVYDEKGMNKQAFLSALFLYRANQKME